MIERRVILLSLSFALLGSQLTNSSIHRRPTTEVFNKLIATSLLATVRQSASQSESQSESQSVSCLTS